MTGTRTTTCSSWRKSPGPARLPTRTADPFGNGRYRVCGNDPPRKHGRHPAHFRRPHHGELRPALPLRQGCDHHRPDAVCLLCFVPSCSGPAGHDRFDAQPERHRLRHQSEHTTLRRWPTPRSRAVTPTSNYGTSNNLYIQSAARAATATSAPG